MGDAVRARRLGRLAPDERAAGLCDPGTFARAGATRRSRHADVPPGDALVCGTGLCDGRPVAVIATDGRVSRGTFGEAGAALATRVLDDARRAGHPVVLLIDSDGARLGEGVPAVIGNARLLAALADLGGHVPRLGAVFGAAGGSAAYALALCDVAVAIAQRSFAFVAGPAVVAEALGEVSALEALGGSDLHASSGLVHALADDDGAALAWLRAALAALPGSAAAMSPDVPARAPLAAGGLAGVVPDDARQGWDVARALDGVVDEGTWLELGARWGPSLRTGLARLDGRAVLVVCSSPRDGAGAIDAAAARKATRFVRFATAFGLPILTLCDTPGFLPGAVSERASVLCHGAALIGAYCEAKRAVTRVALIVRRAVGAGSVLAAEADLVLALPGARVAQMGDAALRALAAASAMAPAERADDDPEASGFVHRTIAPEAVRAELVRAFARLPRAAPMPHGQRRTALVPT